MEGGREVHGGREGKEVERGRRWRGEGGRVRERRRGDGGRVRGGERKGYYIHIPIVLGLKADSTNNNIHPFQ